MPEVIQKLKKSESGAGFTLIETLIYLALFALIIGGGMVATYQIIESTNKTNDKVVVAEDANFLLQKLDWALTGATTVSAPTATSLHITKPAGTFDFALQSDNLTLNSSPLNSSFVKIAPVGGVMFNMPASKQVEITFTVNNQQFNATKYLR